jgi:hypothetical protein
VAIIRGARVCAPWPCTLPFATCAPPPAARAPLSVHAPLAVRALVAVRAPIAVLTPRARPHCHVCPSLPCAPCVRTLLCHARLSHPCAPLPCVPPEYKSHKLIVHSTTWASGPLTTKRWLTTGCLGGDHSIYIHSHSHAQRCACMHVTFHVFLFIFIVNACQLGGHIKLLASLYTF